VEPAVQRCRQEPLGLLDDRPAPHRPAQSVDLGLQPLYPGGPVELGVRSRAAVRHLAHRRTMARAGRYSTIEASSLSGVSPGRTWSTVRSEDIALDQRPRMARVGGNHPVPSGWQMAAMWPAVVVAVLL